MHQNLPPHYRAAIRFALDHRQQDFAEFYSDQLHLHVQRPAPRRTDLAGRIYLEAYEKMPGGITFLNAWRPATATGVRTFFHWLTERRTKFLSPRPYRLAQACDGTINSPVLHAFKVACDALRLDAYALYKAAYPQRDDDPPDWAGCQRHADWQGGVILPGTWDQAALGGLAASLTAINYHSLRSEFVAARQRVGSEGRPTA
jgi:hypothetical protein